MHAEHLWDIPAHRQAWERVAAQEGGFGQLYHSFCHFLETDAIYLLNDAVQTLPTGVRALQGTSESLCPSQAGSRGLRHISD